MQLKSLLFLDVDGVLNSYTSGGLYALKKSCLRRLQEIVEKTGCTIILSSSWRKDAYALKRLKRVLGYRGIKIHDVTPILYKHRGLEIATWLYEHKDTFEGRSLPFAILDDDSDMEDWQLPHFFQTDPEYGLTDTIAYRVIQHLTNP